MDHVKSLRAIFGFDHFRAGQAEAVAAALADRDALVVMPTGSGKSLCYQLPALIRDDLTVVVSPLVSLMQDQAAGLERVALIPDVTFGSQLLHPVDPFLHDPLHLLGRCRAVVATINEQELAHGGIPRLV